MTECEEASVLTANASYIDLNQAGECGVWEGPERLMAAPSWMNAFVSLGLRVSKQRTLGSAELWTVVVPERSYAAILIALGVAISSASTSSCQSTLRPGDEVHWISSNGLKRGTVEAAADGAFIGGYRIRTSARKRSQRDVIETRKSSDLIKTNGHITLDHARVAYQSSRLLESLGVEVAPSWWVEGNPVACLIGDQRRLVEEASALSFGSERLAVSFSDLLMAEPKNTKWHGKTRVISARSEEVDAATMVDAVIFDGSESLHLLQDLSRTNSSSAIVLLLREWEFARIASDLQHVRRSWGGAWLETNVVREVLKGAAGAFAFAKSRSIS